MNLPPAIRVLLWPISLLYGVGARFRVFLYEKGVFRKRRLKTPVISVGNLTMGGTGKTPMVIYLAEKFLAEGKRVGILSRGYRGSGGTSDEVEMLRGRLGDRVLFGVGADRHKEGTKIESLDQVDVFLLDDGFQHLQLERDVDILMVDSSKRTEKEWILPAGTLREPFSACGRADIMVLSRVLNPNESAKAVQNLVFLAQTRLLGLRSLGENKLQADAALLKRFSFYAFCGVGNPEAFFRDLKRWNLELSGTMSFQDHHRYDEQDVSTLLASARGARATAFVTTEKDEQNLHTLDFGDVPVYVATIELEICSAADFDIALHRLLAERQRAAK